MPGPIARSLRPLALAILVVIGPALAAAHSAEPARTDQPEPPPSQALSSQASSLQQKREAAAALLKLDDTPSRALLHRCMLTDNPPGSRRAVAEAIVTLETPPHSIEPSLAAAIDEASDESLGWLLPAAACFRGRTTFAAVVGVLDRQPPPETTSLACQTLTAQTGVRCENAAQWLEWAAATESWTDARWFRTVADAHATATRDAQRRTLELESDLDRLYRQVHALTPVEERSALIASLIRSPRPLLSTIGFDLAKRALLNARPLGSDVVVAAQERLNDPRDQVRRDAANLIDRIDLPGVGPDAAEALQIEPDPEVAAALLRILARQPAPGVSRQIVEWAEQDGPPHQPALDAASAAIRAGTMDDPELIRRVTAVASAEIAAGNPSVSAVRALDAAGLADEAAALLFADDREIAQATAEALVGSPDQFSRLLAAARSHADLFDAAAATIRLLRPNTAGLQTLLALPAPSDEHRRAALARVATALPPTDLLDTARTIDDLAMREACLSHVATPDYSSAPDHATQRRELLRLLLQTRLDRGNADGVLATLAALNLIPNPAPDIHANALLRLARTEEAREIALTNDLPASFWFDALDAQPPDPAAITLILAGDYADALNAEQRQRLDDLEKALADAATDQDNQETPPR